MGYLILSQFTVVVILTFITSELVYYFISILLWSKSTWWQLKLREFSLDLFFCNHETDAKCSLQRMCKFFHYIWSWTFPKHTVMLQFKRKWSPLTYLTKPFMLTSISTLLSFILLAASLNRCRSMLSLWPLTQWIQKEYSKSKATSSVLTMPIVCITIAKGYKPPKVCVPVCTRKDITNTLK